MLDKHGRSCYNGYEVIYMEDKLNQIVLLLETMNNDMQNLKQGQEELKAGQVRLEQRQEKLENRQENLERRQERLEQGQEELKAGQIRLEQRQENLERRQKRLEQGQKELKLGQVRLEARQAQLEKGQEKFGSDIAMMKHNVGLILEATNIARADQRMELMQLHQKDEELERMIRVNTNDIFKLRTAM